LVLVVPVHQMRLGLQVPLLSLVLFVPMGVVPAVAVQIEMVVLVVLVVVVVQRMVSLVPGSNRLGLLQM
jgi:hypothetical protein